MKWLAINPAASDRLARMLTWLTKSARRWAAVSLVLAYALCVLGPVAAFAFGDGVPPCLTEGDHGLAATQVHQHGAEHDRDGAHHKQPHHAGDEQSMPGKCCGLLCFPAVAPTSQLTLEPALHRSTVRLPVERDAPSRAPDRLYRPPIVLLSL